MEILRRHPGPKKTHLKKDEQNTHVVKGKCARTTGPDEQKRTSRVATGRPITVFCIDVKRFATSAAVQLDRRSKFALRCLTQSLVWVIYLSCEHGILWSTDWEDVCELLTQTNTAILNKYTRTHIGALIRLQCESPLVEHHTTVGRC